MDDLTRRAITELLERAEKAERERDAMRDAAIMQQKYQRLYDTHKLSKKPCVNCASHFETNTD